MGKLTINTQLMTKKITVNLDGLRRRTIGRYVYAGKTVSDLVVCLL